MIFRPNQSKKLFKPGDQFVMRAQHSESLYERRTWLVTAVCDSRLVACLVAPCSRHNDWFRDLSGTTADKAWEGIGGERVDVSWLTDPRDLGEEVFYSDQLVGCLIFKSRGENE